MRTNRSLWRRLLDRLSHRATREEERRRRDEVAAVIASVGRPEEVELVALVSETLFHQGEPLANARMLARLLHERRSRGWDEASCDVEGERARISMLGQSIEVDRGELLALLERIVRALEASERARR